MKNKNYYLIGIAVLFLAFFALSINHEKEIEDRESKFNENIQTELPHEITDPTEIKEINEIKAPRTSGSWVLSNFTIDDNGGTSGAIDWATAAGYSWCSGAGTAENPYVIENVTINGQRWKNCIKIQDSTKYFEIRNCTLYNTSLDSGFDWSGALELENVQNGKVIGCNVSNNYWGIWLENSANNIIANNTCFNSGNSGITMAFDGSDSNIVIGNNVSDSSITGIALYGVGPSNNIIENNFINSSLQGIGTYNMGTGNNVITGNTISHCSTGIKFELNTDSNTITKNTIKNCTSEGIHIFNDCDGNIIFNNLIAYNKYSVLIDTSDCSSNTFYHNNFTQNTYNAIDDGTNNNWQNGYIGNYWDNYTGTDPDDDGCGSPTYSISGSAGKQDTLPFCDDNAYYGNPIHVDDDGYYSWNWEFSSTFDWCSGSGTETDPYIIEDLTIDASSGNGILVENSNDVDFIIRNCTIYDSMGGAYPGNIYGCIRLENSRKGQIYSNNLSQTSSGDITNGGLVLYDCTNIIIINNTFDGTKYGILMRYSNENLIYNNTVNYQQHVGIFLHTECHYNNITFNNASYNGIFGIALYDNCTNNRIEDNSANNNVNSGIILIKQYTSYGSSYNFIANNSANYNLRGIYLSDFSNYNTITDNNCSFNTYCGILITTNSYRNIISNNRIENNYDYGIEITINSHDNNCTGNFIYNNEDYGVYLPDSNSDTNWFFNNNFTGNGNHVYDLGTNTKWNSPQIGNYWDDYGFDDDDDDGIGDNSYNVYGSRYDEIPIWWDAPVVSIIFPEYLDLFGNATLNYEIGIDKGNIDDPKFQMWYILDNGTLRKNATFTELTGKINYFLWNNYSSDFINITFYANDSRGFMHFMNVTVEKNVDNPIITIQKLGFQGASSFNAINFTIYKSGKILNTTWYRIYNISYWTVNYTFEGLMGWVNQDLWSSLLDGTYKIQFYINDSINRIGKVNGTVIKDTVDPIIVISDPSPYELFGINEPDINLDITEDNLHKIWYNLDNGSIITKNDFFISNISYDLWKLMGNGTVTITFWANDTAGNLFTGVSIVLLKDMIPPGIALNKPLFGRTYGVVPPSIELIFYNEANFDSCWYTINGRETKYYLTLYGTVLYGQIELSVWEPLSNGEVTIRFFAEDDVGNKNSSLKGVVTKYDESAVSGPVVGDDDDDDGVEEDTMDWIIRALLAGIISGCVGITLRIAYSKIKKKREAAREVAAPTIVLKKKFQIVHHDFLTPYDKVEQKEFRVGIAQVGLSKTGNLITELYDMTPEGLMRIREDMVKAVSANIKSMIESAHENKINILLFPEMTFDLNYKGMVKDVKKWAQKYNMYIITGGYHDIKTKQNICAVFGPKGIQWNQEKHTPATIHFGKKVFTEAIEIQHPPHKLHICATEYGRIAIAICRDFLDMDLRVEIKNCEPPVDLFFNPAYTPVTIDFEATHFDARRSVYAYTFFANVAEYGGTIINTPEKDRTKRQIPPKEEGLIFKDVDLFSLRSERNKWERRQSKEKRYIQSTRS